MNPNPQATKYLIAVGKRHFKSRRTRYPFTGDAEADKLLNDLKNYPHAFVLAAIMDRAINAQRAWLIPQRLKQRIGDFEFETLASLSRSKFKRYMMKPSPLHRYKDKMAEYGYLGIQRIKSFYGGNAGRIWAGNPSSADLVYRFLQFDGIGQKIATMAANILVREFKVSTRDKYSIDISIDGLVPRVLKRTYGFPIKTKDLELVYFARSLNPDYPGIMDIQAWRVGRTWCRPKNPKCDECPMRSFCLFAKARRTKPRSARANARR